MKHHFHSQNRNGSEKITVNFIFLGAESYIHQEN